MSADAPATLAPTALAFPGRLCPICLSVVPPDNDGDYLRRMPYVRCPGPCGSVYGWDEYDKLTLVEHPPQGRESTPQGARETTEFNVFLLSIADGFSIPDAYPRAIVLDIERILTEYAGAGWAIVWIGFLAPAQLTFIFQRPRRPRP